MMLEAGFVYFVGRENESSYCIWNPDRKKVEVVATARVDDGQGIDDVHEERGINDRIQPHPTNKKPDLTDSDETDSPSDSEDVHSEEEGHEILSHDDSMNQKSRFFTGMIGNEDPDGDIGNSTLGSQHFGQVLGESESEDNEESSFHPEEGSYFDPYGPTWTDDHVEPLGTGATESGLDDFVTGNEESQENIEHGSSDILEEDQIFIGDDAREADDSDVLDLNTTAIRQNHNIRQPNDQVLEHLRTKYQCVLAINTSDQVGTFQSIPRISITIR